MVNMTGQSRWIFAFTLGALLALPGRVHADTTNAAPAFKEVYQLLLDNLPGATDESLNRTAVNGLLSQFPGQVSLVGGSADDNATAAALGRTMVLEGNIAYLRVERVEGGLANGLKTAYNALATNNKIVGTVLDLRFAGGDDLAAVQTMAGSIKTIAAPLTILVNGETRGAAEALAAALRTADAGLIIGSPTAGESATFKELPLPDGERLRITTTNGQPAASVQPDITVTVSAEDECSFMADPYAALKPDETKATVNTNSYLPFIDHTSEADLVRAKIKDGDEDESTAAAMPVEPQKPFIHDPALARAVDLIKALAALHPARS